MASRPPNSIEAIEAALVANRIAELVERPIEGPYDAAHLREFHRFIFQDLPKYAPGEYRPYAPSHGKDRRLETNPGWPHRVDYALRPEVDARLDIVLKELRGGDALKGLPEPAFVATMTKLYGDLDYLHPFGEGNSRTLRSFTRQLAEETGHSLDWSTTNANAVTRDALYRARDIEVLQRKYPNLDAVSLSQQDGDRLMLHARQTLQRFEGVDRLDEIIRQSTELGPTAAPEKRTVPIAEAEREISSLMPAARRQAEAAETSVSVASMTNRSLVPAHSEALARKAALNGENAPDRLLAALGARGEASVTFDRVPGATALDRVLAYREGMERKMAIQNKELPNGPPSDDLGQKTHGSTPLAGDGSVVGRGPESGEQGGQRPALREVGGRLAVLVRDAFEAGRGSTVGGLLVAVPAGRAAIPDGPNRLEWCGRELDPDHCLPVAHHGFGLVRCKVAPDDPEMGSTSQPRDIRASCDGSRNRHRHLGGRGPNRIAKQQNLQSWHQQEQRQARR